MRQFIFKFSFFLCTSHATRIIIQEQWSRGLHGVFKVDTICHYFAKKGICINKNGVLQKREKNVPFLNCTLLNLTVYPKASLEDLKKSQSRTVFQPIWVHLSSVIFLVYLNMFITAYFISCHHLSNVLSRSFWASEINPNNLKKP